jgi:type III secretory pathway component EscU
MEKLAGRAKNKTPSVQYAMTAIAKTLMQLFFAMVAILLFIKNVTECLSSRKANGIVGSASSLAKTTS